MGVLWVWGVLRFLGFFWGFLGFWVEGIRALGSRVWGCLPGGSSHARGHKGRSYGRIPPQSVLSESPATPRVKGLGLRAWGLGFKGNAPLSTRGA